MKDTKQELNDVNFLWTGGWDSTFQLLQLLIINKQPVTPFYLIHAPRKSTGIEILTMNRIKNRLFKEYPFTVDLLKPTRFYSDIDLKPDSEITKAYHSALKKIHVGVQYEWLARLCKEIGISDMQLSVEKGPPNYVNWSIMVDPFMKESIINSRKTYELDAENMDNDFYTIFKYFQFPIKNVTKIDMSDITKNQGLYHFMEMTWFCQDPRCNMKPCGKCIPCVQITEAGLGFRLPLRSRIISFFYRTFSLQLKPWLKDKLIKTGLLSKK